jgi:hypothetical protein
MKTITLPKGSVQWPIGHKGNWVGRNGHFSSIGIWLNSAADRVGLYPVGERGRIGNCMIEIPRAAIPFVVKALLDDYLAPTFRLAEPLSPLRAAKAELSQASGEAQEGTFSETSRRSDPKAKSDSRGGRESLTPNIDKIEVEIPTVPRLDADFMKDIGRL